MKEINVTVIKYKCDYCDRMDGDPLSMEWHEADHRRYEKLKVGQRVRYNFDRGYTREGVVVEIDVIHLRFLVQADNGERDWSSLFTARMLEEL